MKRSVALGYLLYLLLKLAEPAVLPSNYMVNIATRPKTNLAAKSVPMFNQVESVGDELSTDGDESSGNINESNETGSTADGNVESIDDSLNSLFESPSTTEIIPDLPATTTTALVTLSQDQFVNQTVSAIDDSSDGYDDGASATTTDVLIVSLFSLTSETETEYATVTDNVAAEPTATFTQVSGETSDGSETSDAYSDITSNVEQLFPTTTAIVATYTEAYVPETTTVSDGTSQETGDETGSDDSSSTGDSDTEGTDSDTGTASDATEDDNSSSNADSGSGDGDGTSSTAGSQSGQQTNSGGTGSLSSLMSSFGSGGSYLSNLLSAKSESMGSTDWSKYLGGMSSSSGSGSGSGWSGLSSSLSSLTGSGTGSSSGTNYLSSLGRGLGSLKKRDNGRFTKQRIWRST